MQVTAHQKYIATS